MFKCWKCPRVVSKRGRLCLPCGKQYRLEHKEAVKQSRDKFRQKHPDRVRKSDSHWHEVNRQKAKQYAHQRYICLNEQQRIERNNRQKDWEQRHPEKMQQYRSRYRRKSYRTDIHHKLRALLRSRFRAAFTGKTSDDHAIDLLGCTVAELKLYLEKLWKPGMSWDNYSYRGWHIDHIRPCGSFDLTQLQERKKCFHYTNLQPLWAKENIEKSGTYDSG